MARKQKLPTCCTRTRTRSQSVLHMARAMAAFGQIWQHTLGQLCMQMLLCTALHKAVWGSGRSRRWGRYSTTDYCGQCAIYQSIYASILPDLWQVISGQTSASLALHLFTRKKPLLARTSAHQITNGHIRTSMYVCVCTQRGAATIRPNSGRVQYTGPSITLCCAVLLVPRITNSAGASYGSRKMLALPVSFLDRQLPSLHPLSSVCCHCQHLLHS